ncbi:MAG: 1-aminocyclopropane-1-carboxylate deaminase/D-cysteine desulfhydrase [Chitinophagales bacterium]|nr:1-aminocyclopropane-1-carboxylate deaminase/D-cysteine desulfhydrase [Chitinophagales bacterium]
MTVIQSAPSPIIEIYDELLFDKGIRVLIKRDDLLHPVISGNKFRKLKFNIYEAQKEGQKRLLTFGGAYSNHIHAVAAAGKLFNFETIGIIRGESNYPLNNTLNFAADCGMRIYYISREEYRKKEEPAYIKQLHEHFGEFYLLPEGGSNALAIRGCAEIIKEITVPYDFLCCPCGTGGTMAGLIGGVAGQKLILGFSVLKGMNDLEEKVVNWVYNYSGAKFSNWNINHFYHFGGYAKKSSTLFSFIRNFQLKNNILLDPVYTGKMMFGMFDLIRKDYFRRGSTIVAIHTGGLQGWGE